MSILLILLGALLVYTGLKKKVVKTNQTVTEFGKSLAESNANEAMNKGFGMGFRIIAKGWLIIAGIIFIIFGLLGLLLF